MRWKRMPDGIAVSAGSERKYHCMKTRIITGVISGALMLLVLFLPWTIVLTVGTSVIAAVAVYELFSVTGMLKHRGLETVAMAFAVIAPFFARLSRAAVAVTSGAYLLIVVFLVLMYAKEVAPARSALAFGMAALVTLSLSCMSYLRTVSTVRDSDGLFYVLLAMVMSWISDIGAYFVGTFFGKHKLCPRLSPKKTVEGLVGGVASALVLSSLTALIYDGVVLKGTANVSYGGLLMLALICSLLSVAGDLSASFIKRCCKVKDYGNIFPGHGGVMDRFDSLLFVFPVMYFVARVMPIIA